jgi:hypothetical protein
MSGWQLVTLLAALFNTGALLYWQRANEERMDAQWERLRNLQWGRLRNLQGQTKEIVPMLKQNIAHIQEWERWRDSEWQEIVNAAAVLLDEQREGDEHPAMKTCVRCGTAFPTEMPQLRSG